MKSLTLIILSFFLVSGFSGCVSKTYKSPKKSITVMTYNVENLFDAMDDPGKEDETYLPLAKKKTSQHKAKCAGLSRQWWRQQCLETDWNENKIERKINRIADVVLQVKNGRGPDVLVLQEVENLNILKQLQQNGLGQAGYKEAILIEGPDKRGIDVAMLSKLPQVGGSVLHEIKLDYIDRKTGEVDPSKEARPTRGILQAQFKLPDDEKLIVLGVHFPSQGSPTPARRKALEKLEEVRKALPEDSFVIATGDFNITAVEDGREGLFAEVSNNWLVSHQLGCQSCEGTHNYRGSWSFLDVMLFSKNFKKGSWVVDAKSIRIPNKSIYQLNHFGGPARFNDGRAQKGVSDHWPLAADIIPGGVQ